MITVVSIENLEELSSDSRTHTFASGYTFNTELMSSEQYWATMDLTDVPTTKVMIDGVEITIARLDGYTMLQDGNREWDDDLLLGHPTIEEITAYVQACSKENESYFPVG